MADANLTSPASTPGAGTPPPPAPGTGPGPLGVPGGTDRSYQVDIMVCAVLTAVIGTVFVALRFYTRRVIVHVLGWEDWLILIAQIFSIAMCAGFVVEATLGHGSHAWLNSLENLMALAKVAWVTILFYELSLWFSQISILMLYIRIWTYTWVRRTAYVLLAIVMVYNILVTIMVVTACVPLNAFWDFTVQGAYCHAKNIWWANTYLHVITDFMIYLLPMPVILRLRFPTRQKVLLFVLFAFGFFICLISLIRLYMLKITADTMDYTFDNVSIAFWSCVETNATVVIACFMTMKPLLAKWFPGLTAPSQNSNGEQDAVADPTGRVPTIGTRPIPTEQQQSSWKFFQGKQGAGDLDVEEHEEKDLEAGRVGAPETPESKETPSALQSFTSGSTLEQEPAPRKSGS